MTVESGDESIEPGGDGPGVDRRDEQTAEQFRERTAHTEALAARTDSWVASAKARAAHAKARAAHAKARATRAKARAARIVFGDDVGLLLFLVATAFSVVTWRVGFFINDNWTLANAFVAVADGHLHVEVIQYGPQHGKTPGLDLVDGRRYAYNYGQLFASLPVLWLLWAVSAIADPAVAIVAGFGLLVLSLCVQFGRVLDREVAFSYAGVVLSLATVAANLPFAVELRPFWLPFAALQLATIVAASLSVVVLYRLLRRMYGRRIGAAGGAVAALASPIPFWATIPKRHALVALLVLVALYCFYRSRETTSVRASIRWHALAYVQVGLVALVNPAEAIVLFVALAIPDAVTVPRPVAPRLAAAGGAFLASLLPFLLTNWLVSGDVLTPPRIASLYGRGLLVAVDAGDAIPARGAFAPASTGVGQPGPGFGVAATAGGERSVLSALWQWLVVLMRTALTRVETFLDFVGQSRGVVLDGDRMYRIFVRRGYVDDYPAPGALPAVSLSVLETMPVLGGLLAVPVALARALRSRVSGRTRWSVRGNPTVAADLFVCWFVVVLCGLYLSFLPNKASWTVRYLHPLYPLGVYVLLRNPAMRDAILGDSTVLAVTYVVAVLAGSELFVLAFGFVDPTLGEAVQVHALVAVTTGSLLGIWAVPYTAVGDGLTGSSRRYARRTGAVLVALAAAATTILLVLWAVVYFPHAQFALPGVGELAEAIPFPSR